MANRTLRLMAAATLLVLAGMPLRADELPPAVGMGERARQNRAALFAELTAAKDEADAREIEDKIWAF